QAFHNVALSKQEDDQNGQYRKRDGGQNDGLIAASHISLQRVDAKGQGPLVPRADEDIGQKIIVPSPGEDENDDGCKRGFYPLGNDLPADAHMSRAVNLGRFYDGVGNRRDALAQHEYAEGIKYADRNEAQPRVDQSELAHDDVDGDN